MFQFKVHNVTPNPTKKSPINNFGIRDAWSKFGGVKAFSPLEVGSGITPFEVFTNPSLLAVSVYQSFYDHYPLVLNPNAIWLTITQGFSHYVEENAEALRDKFVTFEGKKELLVKRYDFSYGNPKNDWGSAVGNFASQIEKYIGSSTRHLIECDFTNSTLTDRVVSHITLMDVCKYYFIYKMMCGCGIPYIRLLGTVDDWKLIRQKAEALKSFSVDKDEHLNNWLKDLLPALDHFISAASGNPDLFFWGSVCNMSGSSGAKDDPLTGWISVFYPYGSNGRELRSNWMKAYEEAKKKGVEVALKESQTYTRDYIGGGIRLTNLSSGISKANVHVEWLDVGKEEDLEFYGGLSTLYQHPDGGLEALTGWAIVNPSEKSKSPFNMEDDF
jgi:hypothetical protein